MANPTFCTFFLRFAAAAAAAAVPPSSPRGPSFLLVFSR